MKLRYRFLLLGTDGVPYELSPGDEIRVYPHGDTVNYVLAEAAPGSPNPAPGEYTVVIDPEEDPAEMMVRSYDIQLHLASGGSPITLYENKCIGNWQWIIEGINVPDPGGTDPANLVTITYATQVDTFGEPLPPIIPNSRFTVSILRTTGDRAFFITAVNNDGFTIGKSTSGENGATCDVLIHLKK